MFATFREFSSDPPGRGSANPLGKPNAKKFACAPSNAGVVILHGKERLGLAKWNGGSLNREKYIKLPTEHGEYKTHNVIERLSELHAGY